MSQACLTMVLALATLMCITKLFIHSPESWHLVLMILFGSFQCARKVVFCKLNSAKRLGFAGPRVQ